MATATSDHESVMLLIAASRFDSKIAIVGAWRERELATTVTRR
jgi:hypothetical protein